MPKVITVPPAGESAPAEFIQRGWCHLKKQIAKSLPTLSASMHFMSLFGLAMTALVWLGVEHNLSIRYGAVSKSAEQNIDSLSRIFEEHVSRAVRDADKSLLLLRAAFESSPKGSFDLRAWVGNEQFRTDLDVQYALIGADGMMLASNLGPANALVDLSDREHFRVQLTSTSDELFISKPVLGRASGKWSIQLTRKLQDKQGAFAGVLVSSLDPYHLTKLYESVDLGRDGAITLVGLDGVIRARGGTSADVLGKSMIKSEIFIAAKGQSTGILKGAGVVDGVQRLLSYRVVPKFPLIVTAAMSEREIFAEFDREKRLYRLAGLVLTFIIMAFTFASVRSRLRLDATLAHLAVERDAAQQANSAKSTFLAMMSHEIRTPMNAMLGLTSVLLEGELAADQRTALTTVQQAGDSLLEILNDILDYSKLEAGQLSLEGVPFAPKDVADAAISVISSRADAKGLALNASTDPTLPAGLLGDVGRLRQVLLNLISNAVKFTAKGSVSVECRCIDKTETHATVEWRVTDTGIGISLEQIDSLFKDYAQADTSINRRFGGSGLGLAICKRILSSMGGNIEVQSVLGQGTTIRCRVELPVVNFIPEVGRDDTDCERLSAKIHALTRPMRILIVDDNATNRLVAAKMLQQFNVQVGMAADGAEGVTLATETDFDAILMDMQMPEMDGIAASRAIRARGLSVPIIAFTANAFDDDRQACKAAGMSDFVPKPVRKPLLVSAIERALAADAGVTESHAGQQVQRGADASSDTVVAFERGAYDELAEAIGDDGIDEAMASFVSETRLRLANLRSLGGESDCEVVKREAHTLKGAAATFGFCRLTELARWLELNCADLGMAARSSAVERMELAFHAGQAAFRECSKPIG